MSLSNPSETALPPSLPPRVPVPVLLTALVSLAALWVTTRGELPLIWLFGLLCMVSYALPTVRLPDGSRLHFPAFVLLGLAAYATMPPDAQSTYDLIGPPRIRNLIAQLYAAEMVIQFWRHRTKTGDAHQSPLLILLLSGLILLSASNTFDDRFIRFFSPLYLLFVALSLQGYRARQAAFRSLAAPVVLRAFALLLALGMGGAAYRATTVYRGNLADLANRLSGYAPPPPRMEATGMASQPQLGPLFNLRGTPVRVLRINNFSGDPHWHGVAYDTYEAGSGTWGPSVADRKYQAALARTLQPPSSSRLGGTETVLVSRLVSDNPLVFFPLATSELDKGDAPGLSADLSDGGPMRTPRRTPSPYDYTLTLAPRETYQGLWAVPLNTERRARALNIPDKLNPAINALAQTIAGGEKSDQKKADAVVAYLLTYHPYSLNFPRNSGQYPDPLADFLLSRPYKGAHCEFFAASAAILLRCVHVPTRYVTGYFAHEGVGDNTTVVRQRDAHAWCEAWIEGVGWVVVEATPASGRPDGMTDDVEVWRKATEWLQDRLQIVSDFVSNLTPTQTNAFVGGTMVLALAYGGWIILARRRKQNRAVSTDEWAYSPANPTLAQLAARFETVWAQKTGSRIPRQQPYDEYLTHLPMEPLPLPALREIARAWVNRYDRARFGSTPTETDLANLRDLLKQMEEVPPPHAPD